ncbi:hypothetical protein JOD69_001153 [Methylocaldum sp. RMAD-M]|jgi:hypothetical protein|nr:hypothetical protein [Methylocaldum sp. RMAD-M]
MSNQAPEQQKGNAAWELAKRYKTPLIAGGAGGGGLLYAASQCSFLCPTGWWWSIGAFSCIPC